MPITPQLSTLKSAQLSFKTLLSTTKTAMDDPAMGAPDRNQMIEQVFEQAEALVNTAVAAIEQAEGGAPGAVPAEPSAAAVPPAPAAPAAPAPGAVPGGEPPGGAPPTEPASAPADPEKTAMGGNHDPTKVMTAEEENKQEIQEVKKELDAMKLEKEQMKLAQKYADLWPVAMQDAKFAEFMGHKDALPILVARLDEATVNLSKDSSIKIAQTEERPFHLENVGEGNQSKVHGGGKF